ncbi:phosphoribosyl-AMP cyclohydrolase [Desulfosarcina sp.]|uniref:phosphoribosyl-AMP cyclohydrolase n=1 Tax=Desulfosarcina sp. TaxID=2027861 RepID=UPI003569151B
MRSTTERKPMIELNFEKMGGLIPAIAQDHKTGEVLMLAFMNRAAWEETLKTRRATYYSRTRDALWVKGLTSGHIQHVKEIRVDCDDDAVLLKVDQAGGAACHTRYASCFHQREEGGDLVTFGQLVFDPKEVYKE